MYKRILVPLDGSTLAESALPVAARIARATGGSVLLVEVVKLPIDYSGGLAQVPMLTEQVIESEMAGSSGYLKSVVASPVLAGIKITTDVSLGLSAQNILAAAEAHESDLIVLCSHGRTGFTRWALGSVAHTLVHQSTIPVLVLRQSESFPSPLLNVDTARPLCALVPLDGSPLAETALNPAAHLITALASPAQGALQLVQVVKIFPATAEEGVISELNQEALQRARAYMATVTERLQATEKELHLSLTYSVELESDVANALLSLAEQEGISACSLIAISTHGRGGLERWVMGSVTERLLDTTKLPMLIVRPQKKAT